MIVSSETNSPIFYCLLSKNTNDTFHSNIKDMHSMEIARLKGFLVNIFRHLSCITIY